MNDYDKMIERQCEADGVRMASGHHISTPADDPTACGCWWSRTGTLLYPCDDHYSDGWKDRRDDDR